MNAAAIAEHKEEIAKALEKWGRHVEGKPAPWEERGITAEQWLEPLIDDLNELAACLRGEKKFEMQSLKEGHALSRIADGFELVRYVLAQRDAQQIKSLAGSTRLRMRQNKAKVVRKNGRSGNRS